MRIHKTFLCSNYCLAYIEEHTLGSEINMVAFNSWFPHWSKQLNLMCKHGINNQCSLHRAAS